MRVFGFLAGKLIFPGAMIGEEVYEKKVVWLLFLRPSLKVLNRTGIR
jgi:hypothetical protein